MHEKNSSPRHATKMGGGADYSEGGGDTLSVTFPQGRGGKYAGGGIRCDTGATMRDFRVHS